MNAVNKSNEELRISVARETGLSVQSVNVCKLAICLCLSLEFY